MLVDAETQHAEDVHAETRSAEAVHAAHGNAEAALPHQDDEAHDAEVTLLPGSGLCSRVRPSDGDAGKRRSNSGS